MSLFSTANHLILKRIKTSFSKDKRFQNKPKQIRNLLTHEDKVKINLSVDVKNFMSKEKIYFPKSKTNNTLNLDEENSKKKKTNSLMFSNVKSQLQNNTSIQKIKNAYGESPTPSKNSLSIYNSHKSIREKRKNFYLVSGTRKESSIVENNGLNTPNNNITSKQNKTVNIQKQVIIQKYEKVKQLLKNEKYSQASVYLKQIIPYIEEKQKKKQLYFWLIASLIKSNAHSHRLQIVQSYIVECLQQFPNFYDVYLYWAKTKLTMNLVEQAIQIYQKALSINNKHSQAYIQLSSIYLKQGKNRQAKKILDDGFRLSLNSISIPLKIIENYFIFNLNLDQNLKEYVKRIELNCSKKSTQYLYALGFIQKEKLKSNQALIYFQQSLKYNSNKNIATKCLENIINIHIMKRDFYAACYDLKRSKHLNIDAKKIQKYQSFLQGVNFVMKKQNQQGIKLLNKIVQNSIGQKSKIRLNSFFHTNNILEQKQQTVKINQQILNLTIKYLAYAYFKLGKHKQSVKYYKLLQKENYQLDKVSKYNLLIAEGIAQADFQHHFDISYQKFQQAKSQLNKVQPWIYQAMVTIQRKVYEYKKRSKKNIFFWNNIQQSLKFPIIEALNLMQQGSSINNSSSNLLYHRTIMHLHFSSFKSALQDINLCIQKAEQNLPKYFYLRGICYACIKDLKKAINQFSISISLSKQYSMAFLQRSKCYFLSGETQMGFHDLKIYMDKCPDDYHVHSWIGDLLFEGTSYTDSVKAYNQMGQRITIQTLCMRLKAQMRVGSFKQIQSTMNEIKSNQCFNEKYFEMDMAAYNLFSSLFASSSTEKEQNSIEKKLVIINQILEKEVEKGYIFSLVDCMNLIGIANFYISKYVEAYEAFLLVFQFLQSSKSPLMENGRLEISRDKPPDSQKIQKQKLNTQFQQQNLDLRAEDIIYNIFICLLAMKDIKLIKNFLNEEEFKNISSKNQKRTMQKIINHIIQCNQNQQRSQKKSAISFSSKNSTKLKQKKDKLIFYLEPRIENQLNLNLKKFDIAVNFSKSNFLVKTSLIWTAYHGSNESLYFSTMAKRIVYQLHAGYIDNMPEGPWIRRNKFGVLFTDNILDEGNESSFITTHRPEDQQNEKSCQSNEKYEQNDFCQEKSYNDSQDQRFQKQDIEEKKKAFIKQMKLDLKVEKKLNKLIKLESQQK